MKKIILIVVILGISIATFIYRDNFFAFVSHLESLSVGKPLLTATILILLKTFTAPIGFPGTPLTLLTGSLLGNFFGTIIALIGNTLGATLTFLISRYILRDYVQTKIISKHPIIKEYEDRLENHALSTVIILRLIPLFPFNALNFLLGVTNIPLKKYIIGSFVGMIPGTFLFVYLGESFRMLSFVNIISAVGGIILLTYLGKKYMKKENKKTTTNNNFNKIYDVIVIGAGSGGLNIAGFMNKAGFKVLLIDKEDRSIGGDCLNYGCVPSKALIHIARLVRDGRQAERFGITTSGEIDIKKVMEYVDSKKEIIREHENAEHFRKLGMDVALGLASFVNNNTVEVAGVRYTGKKIVVATGSRPRKLVIPGIELVKKIYTNENIFSVDYLPKHMVVVGTGPIGIEVGQAFSALGTKVTVLGSKLLEKEDPEIVTPLKESLEREGVDIQFGFRPSKVIDEKTLLIDNGSGIQKEINFDMLFVSIGRTLNVEKLNLQAAKIEMNDRGGIVVDEYLRTTNKNVLVCGDVAGGHMFTHAAELHASLIIRNFFSPFKKKLNTDTMAWVTYTSPEIATFGLSEKTLKERGVTYEVLTKDFSDSDRAITDEHTSGKVKLLISKKGIILGGSMVAENAGEIVQELMLAQANGMSLNSLTKKVYPYPTASRINRSVAFAFLSRRLTTRAKKIFHLLFH